MTLVDILDWNMQYLGARFYGKYVSNCWETDFGEEQYVMEPSTRSPPHVLLVISKVRILFL